MPKTQFVISAPAHHSCRGTYSTDSEAMAIIDSLIESADRTGDASAVQAAVFAGLSSGRITFAPEQTTEEEPDAECTECTAVGAA